tara:strand:+ start:546 stop:1214 length:669 start_codon:yes stop_codon:yes gene_type:complete
MNKQVNDSTEPLTGTTEARQETMDEICRTIKEYTDLASLQAQVNDSNNFKSVFTGFNDHLKRPTTFNQERGNGFQWNNEQNGNPVILGAAFDGLPEEDALSYTFMMDGVELDWKQPSHYRSNPQRHSLVYGRTSKQEAIAIQGNWTADIGGRTVNWWAYTALFVPRGDCYEWFESFIKCNFNVATIEEYADWVEEDRATRQQAYEVNQLEGQSRGALIASNI